MTAKWLVVDALLNLEGSHRFGGIGGFVNVSRHRDNLLANGLGAFKIDVGFGTAVLIGNPSALEYFPVKSPGRLPSTGPVPERAQD
jgi:hypothetical protein